MSDERERIRKRFIELANKSYGAGIYTFTDFLGLSEQTDFDAVKKDVRGVSYTAFGGADGAERVMIRFGSEEELGYELPFPISTLKISAKDKRFAEKLTHRDYLGAILNLGIERDCLGDIVVRDGFCYLFAKDGIAEYIKNELFRVRHTEVTVEISDTAPDGELYKTERKRVQVSGERLDAVIARVFSLSREDAQSLFTKRLVFAAGREIDSTSYKPKQSEVISVRGYGRFIYLGYESLSKKGKLNVDVEVYI